MGSGAVYSEAVLRLVRLATTSLLLQIPFIAMASYSRPTVGNIDELIATPMDKLKTFPDARVILRTGGSKYSSPIHAAWYFRSKEVDIEKKPSRPLRLVDPASTRDQTPVGKRPYRDLSAVRRWNRSGLRLRCHG
jgi:hypothetical protein